MELTDFTTISKNDIDFLVDSNDIKYKPRLYAQFGWSELW